MTAFDHVVVEARDEPSLAAGRATPGLLSAREEETLARLWVPLRRRKWLLGRSAAKRVVGAAVGAAPHTITVGNDELGAPWVEIEGLGRLPRALSISHRDGLGVAALARAAGTRLGIDLELVAPRDAALVRTFFTAREARATQGGALSRLVARTWSAKEAVLKALGLGLRMDPLRVEVGPELPGPAPDLPPGWRALEARLDGAPVRAGYQDRADFVLTVALLG